MRILLCALAALLLSHCGNPPASTQASIRISHPLGENFPDRLILWILDPTDPDLPPDAPPTAYPSVLEDLYGNPLPFMTVYLPYRQGASDPIDFAVPTELTELFVRVQALKGFASETVTTHFLETPYSFEENAGYVVEDTLVARPAGDARFAVALSTDDAESPEAWPDAVVRFQNTAPDSNHTYTARVQCDDNGWLSIDTPLPAGTYAVLGPEDTAPTGYTVTVEASEVGGLAVDGALPARSRPMCFPNTAAGDAGRCDTDPETRSETTLRTCP